MGILRKLKEWREDADGTLEGPSLKTESATVTNEIDAGSVNTDSLSITAGSGKQIAGLDLIEDKTDLFDEDDSFTLVWDNNELDRDGTYYLDIHFRASGDTTDLSMWFNTDDPSGDESYTYWTQTGTEHPNQDKITLVENTTSFNFFSVELLLGQSDRGQEIGFNSSVRPIRPDRTGEFATSGGGDNPGFDLNEIYVEFPGATQEGPYYARLFEVREP